MFSSLGLALGGLITSALVQYAPAPTHVIWWALLAVFAAGVLAVPAMAEPGSRRPGALASLRPRVAVPRQVRGTFAAAVPCIVSGWALGGLYLSLGPSLAAQATNSADLLWGGLVIFLICGTGAAAALALRGISSRAASARRPARQGSPGHTRRHAAGSVASGRITPDHAVGRVRATSTAGGCLAPPVRT